MIWNDEARIPNDERYASDCYRPVARPVCVRSRPVRPSSFVIRQIRAFTLVELLIVIAIIGILSALLIGVAATAAEQARGSRTKSMIAKLHNLVMQQYDTYKDRRAPMNLPYNSKRSQLQAAYRLSALRELMLMEMPDRWSDVLLNSVENVSTASDLGQPRFLAVSSGSTFGGPSPLIETYRRQYFAMRDAGVSAEDIITNQGAECLYMIVMHATADGEARGLFGEATIADTDGDGANEFIDGWGNPIGFIRWPAGYESSKQGNARLYPNDFNDPKWISDAAIDHDPFDVYRVDANAFRMMPLIYSMGPDERANLHTADETVVWPTGSVGTPLRPYAQVNSDDAGSQYLGSPLNDDGTALDIRAGTDNITNHNLTGE